MEKDTGKVSEFCQSRKVGTLIMEHPSPRGQTNTSENITFPQLCLQAVKNNCSKTV